MKIALVVAVVLGCSAQPKPPPHNTGASPPPVVHHAEMAQKICDRAHVLRDEGCAPFATIDPSLLADCSVASSIFIATIEQCMFEPTCDGMHTCVDKIRAEGGVYRGPTGACQLADGESDLVPAGVSDAEVRASYGSADKTFADSPSSRDRPIEVCGMPSSAGYLTRVTCADGSKAFPDRDAATRARRGNVGPGGRCGRVIDRYEVPCPERTYDVFLDAYRCPRAT
jgi:hypothetical protein